jgi:hypothetical protein
MKKTRFYRTEIMTSFFIRFLLWDAGVVGIRQYHSGDHRGCWVFPNPRALVGPVGLLMSPDARIQNSILDEFIRWITIMRNKG